MSYKQTHDVMLGAPLSPDGLQCNCQEVASSEAIPAAVIAKNLSKVYRLYDKPIDRLKESLHPFRRSYHRDFWALRDVSFEIPRGKAVGIVGKNGSGKSTLLKIIASVLTPTSGELLVGGKVAALLELGAGFNPEQTGLENVYFSGAIMGFSHRAMEEKLDDILGFADIGHFISQPVKTYSSGMFARLAFAVAINVEPDLLIVDEVLSVGDARFQIKCLNQIEAIRSRGTTILFVSHATEQVKRFCELALWIDGGALRLMGDAAQVADAYLDSLHLEDFQDIACQTVRPIEQTSCLARIRGAESCHKDLQTFDDLEVTVEYEVFPEAIDDFLLGVAIYDRDRKYIFGPNTCLDKVFPPCSQGVHRVVYRVPKLPLLAGTYFVDVGLFTHGGLVCLDYINNIASFTVAMGYFAEGLVYLNHEWKIKSDESPV